ncbi:pyridoxamine 5'-phosphate oxidase-related FMN-binding protein [Desulfobulbus propionicus DSM 2032]|uniref:Pyridoxamine 5'-phosphate oxidase-related FMN-binding protein n=1 Tax=Desulfobulbus propionicus (strain ATCC 33891 / DSM 2032 / VKM B-1956 / 1pr3) TaxID=577650 RepID=A0A7U3YN48_DESPD|nr:pyridoxamine 5'-phosphate oxidase family protein [Desulfobulbus propionicus]ADW18293.1 pyridoxamine 5'-phosphate oxidase-related FMN-binding protein [Desulfobulbus propionicus DSM 2032]
MDIDPVPINSQLITLFGQQRLAVVATDSGSGPYTSLVAFAVTPDLGRLIFLTSRATQKFRNIESRPQVALLIDNRSNQPVDLARGVAVTALGTAAEAQGAAREELLQLLRKRHPELGGFADEPSTAVIAITVSRYIVVSHFQEVRVLGMDGGPTNFQEKSLR